MTIFFTSDLHLCHNKPFIYKARGFNTIEEMNEEIIRRWNERVKKDDEVWLLGDVMLNDIDEGIACLKRLNGKIRLIIGNHDNEERINAMAELSNIRVEGLAYMLNIDDKRIFLCHYPTHVNNFDDTKDKGMYCFYGHTHQVDHFFNTSYSLYHVGVDAHDLYPVALEDILKEIHERKHEDDVE